MLIGNLGKDPDVQTLAGNIKSLFGNWFWAESEQILFQARQNLQSYPGDPAYRLRQDTAGWNKIGRLQAKIQFLNKL